MGDTVTRKLKDFFSKFKLLDYKKKEIILRGDDSLLGVYFLEKGYVKEYSVSQEGKELTFIVYKPGDFFPFAGVFNETPNSHFFQVMTSAKIWRAPKKEFIEFIQDNPSVFLELTNHIVVRLGGLLQRMEHLTFGNAYAKVASIILICAERFGKKKEDKIIIRVPLTHRDIASFLGIARETASVEIKKIERKGLIAYRGGLLIVKNKEGLEQESLLTSP